MSISPVGSESREALEKVGEGFLETVDLELDFRV